MTTQFLLTVYQIVTTLDCGVPGQQPKNKHTIGLKKSNNGHWKLAGTNWSRFINRSGYEDIATLHFIWEGADTFYVTGYNKHSSEISGYNDLMTQQRRSRILVTLRNDPDPRIRHACNWKGHSVVHEDEEAVFYQTLSRHVKNEGSLATLPDFVTANDLFIFDHAKIVYGKKSYRLELHQEFYNDDPSCVNDMKLAGNWRRISQSNDLMFTLKIHHIGNFTSAPGRIYHCAEIKWHDLDDSETFLKNRYDSMLEDLGTGKGVVIKEVMEDDEVKEASETGNSGKQLLSVTENNVQTKTEPSTPPWSFESLSDSDFSDHPPWSSESMNKKGIKGWLHKKDPVNYQHDPYHGEDKVEENAELFDEQDHLLEHVPFLKETIVIVYGDASLLAVDSLVVHPVIVLDEQLEIPNKRRKLNPA
nr:hypothetical protein [Tanacetum cinerariifolium]